MRRAPASKRRPLIASLMVVIAFAIQGVPAAQAYDASACGSSPSWEDVDQFRLNAGQVDFGDDLHLGGAPQGTAVVCWSGNVADTNATTVLLRGKLFYDSLLFHAETRCALAKIFFLDGANTVRGSLSRAVCGIGGGVKSRDIRIFDNVTVAKLRIEFYVDVTNVEEPQLQRTVFVRFGD